MFVSEEEINQVLKPNGKGNFEFTVMHNAQLTGNYKFSLQDYFVNRSFQGIFSPKTFNNNFDITTPPPFYVRHYSCNFAVEFQIAGTNYVQLSEAKPFFSHAIYGGFQHENKPYTKKINSPMQPETSGTSRINLTYLYELSDGSLEFVKEMLEMFLTTVPDAITEIKSAIAKNDWEKVRATAHRIKPSFGFIGATVPEELLRQIENNSLDAPEHSTQNKLIDEVEQYTVLCIDEIKKELNTK